MALRTQQTQRLSTRIAITPQIRQSIHILQLPILELKQYVDQQLEENPMLEAEVRDELLQEPQERFEPEAAAPSQTNEPSDDTAADTWTDEWEALFGEDDQVTDGRWGETPSPDALEQQRYRETLVTPAMTLHDHLLSQARLLSLDAELATAAHYIIGCLDDAGYLNSTVGEIAEALRLPAPRVEEALAAVQRLEPVGVGARSLQECLLLQLRALGKEETLATRIVREHLPTLAKRHVRQIAQALRVRPEAVLEAAREIQMLNPKPGAPFTAEKPGYVAADIVIQHDGERYAVTVNDADLPSLRIHRDYRHLLKSDRLDATARHYLKERMDAAMWLIKAISQRNKTLERIAGVVLEVQHEFFERGAGYLKPLTFREVALKVGVHESTVSRAIAHKYVETPQGLLAFHHLFDRGIQQGGASSAEATSSEAVKTLLKTLIDRENAGEPLSDEALTDLIARRSGVKIARRTVAKYREELRIPASFQRRQQAALSPSHGNGRVTP